MKILTVHKINVIGNRLIVTLQKTPFLNVLTAKNKILVLIRLFLV